MIVRKQRFADVETREVFLLEDQHALAGAGEVSGGGAAAWSAADNAVQVHGGNGFALEFPVSRILCDARILNIFEGAAEIQAQVIARRLLDGTN